MGKFITTPFFIVDVVVLTMKYALVLSVVSADALVSASIYIMDQLASAIETIIPVQEMLMVTTAVVSNNF